MGSADHLGEVDERQSARGFVQNEVEFVEIAVDQTVAREIDDHLHHGIIQLVVRKVGNKKYLRNSVVFGDLVERNALR